MAVIITPVCIVLSNNPVTCELIVVSTIVFCIIWCHFFLLQIQLYFLFSNSHISILANCPYLIGTVPILTQEKG